MLEDIILKLRAAKKIGEDIPVKAIAYDTAGNYLVQYKNNTTVAYVKQMVECDGDKFVYELINNGNLQDYELHIDEDGEVAIDDALSQPDVRSDEEVSE